MSNALSNPYELTINGNTCRTSPYGNGFIIDGADLEKLGEKKETYRNDLYRLYHCNPRVNTRTGILESITVFGKKSQGIQE